jgi:ribonuclease HI
MAINVHIYTDGSSRGNPGPGGYGIVMQWVGTSYVKEFSQGYVKTTNNRMELLAVIVALEQLKNINTEVKVFTDSKYVVDSVVKKWVFNWEKKQFKDKKNPDLWKRFLKIYRKQIVSFQWIKGHNNNKLNDRCDYLAVESSKKNDLLVDAEYVKNENNLLL